jgi:hypothetical protein
VIAAKLIGPTGQVYSFEPLPAKAALIRKNIKPNVFENVKIIEAASPNNLAKGYFRLPAIQETLPYLEKAAACAAFNMDPRYQIIILEDSYLGSGYTIEHYLAVPTDKTASWLS